MKSEVLYRRLYLKYKDHAKNIERITMFGPRGHHPRGAAEKAFAACMDLGMHEGEYVPQPGTMCGGYFKCNPDCLTCAEQKLIGELSVTTPTQPKPEGKP